MSGEAGQKEELFTGRIGGLIVTLRITPRKDFLAVFVQDPSATEVYIQEVTAKFLQSSETLSGFNSYVELYEYLSKNFAKVTFAGNALKFVYKEKAAFVDLVLKVRSNFPEALTPSEISQIEARIAAQKRVLQEQLTKIKNAHQAQVTQLKLEITRLKEEGGQFKEQAIKKQAGFQLQIARLEKELASIQCLAQPAFYNNPGNSDMFYYTVATISPTDVKLARQAGALTYHNFVNGVEIPKGKQIRYTVRAIKAVTQNIMVGFCTSSGFGVENNQHNAESAYYSYNGLLTVGGKSKDLQILSIIGDMIELEVNLEAKTIAWWKDQVELSTVAIPEKMLGKKIYLSILMWQSGDVLQLSV